LGRTVIEGERRPDITLVSTIWSLREKLVKIGAKVVTHAKYVVFQLAEVAVPRALFAAILDRIGRLRRAGDSGRRGETHVDERK